MLYGIEEKKTSPLLFAMISMMGLTIFLSGLHVGALCSGLAPSRALAVMLLARVLFEFKFTYEVLHKWSELAAYGQTVGVVVLVLASTATMALAKA